MSYNFIPTDREQDYLLPPSLKDWLPENHLAWFILDVVDQMDLSELYENYREDGVGNRSFHPEIMLGLLLYSYSTGEFSSRKIEKKCQTDIAYRIITANQNPDHCTICRFRKNNEAKIKGIFLEVLKLCSEAGLVKLGNVSLDGTKIKANASLASNRKLKHLEEEIEKLLEAAETQDREESQKDDQAALDLPKAMRNRKDRIERLKKCKARLEKEKTEVEENQRQKIEKRAEKEKQCGKKPRGRKPKPPEEASKKDAKANATDPDSRIMKTRQGYVQGLNGQAIATEEQIIIAEALTQEENDKQQIHPMIEEMEANRKALKIEEEIEVLLADAGYGSEANFNRKPAANIEMLVAIQKEHKQKQASSKSISEDLPATRQMEEKLQSARGQQLYKIRGKTIEPIFGQIKEALGFRRFMRRGLKACQSEWTMICAVHNLLKLYRMQKA